MTRQIAAVTALAVAAAGWFGWAVLTAHRWPVTGAVQGHVEIDLKAMGDFPLNPSLPDGGTPKVFRDLDGKAVAIEGFVYHRDTAVGQTQQFQFVYNVPYRGVPHVQERIFCTMPNGGTVYNPGEYTFVRLFGTLHVGLHRDPSGEPDSLYRLDVERVEPIP